ncbi:hypothetical protein AX14_011014 [Amanita brunnescens Koide BX004]|nr:hypothetical protein AX14_011014 [Amanita brunnescens Koide BX004]
MFSFKPADVQAPAGQSATTGASATSNFSFAFGGAPQASGDAKKDTTVSAGKSPFSFGSSNPTTSNISTSGGAGFPGFGNTQTPSTATSDAPSKPAPFGTGFGANTDIFGTGGQSSSGTKPAEPPKSNFTWPTTSSASPANSATTTTDAPKAPSAFGNVDTSAAQAAAPASSKFPFDVGGSNSLNKTGSTFAAAPTFGMSSTPSSFGGGGSGAFGFPSSTSAPSPFAPAGSGRSLFGSTSGATGNGQSALGSTNASSAPSASDAVGNAPSAATSTTSPFGSGQSMFGSTTSTPSAFGVPSGGTFSFGGTSSEKPALAFGNMASFQSTNQPAFSSTSTEKPGPTASAPVLGNIATTNLGTPFSFESSSSSNTNGSSGGQS